jgi:hypothetical protein
MDRVQTLVHSDRRLSVTLTAEDLNLFQGKDPNSGLTSGFSTMTMPLHMMHSWLRNALQEMTIRLIHLT